MLDQQLLRRIRKCLALGASANEHEAAGALAKARQLMAEHGVTDEMLALAEVEEAAARSAGTATPALWQRHLVAVVRRALAVEAFLDGGQWRFVGRGPSAAIAAYAFTALFRRLKAARAEYMRTTLRRCTLARKRVRADAFCEGWAGTVFSMITKLAPAVPTDSAVASYLALRYPGLTACRPARSGADGKRTVNDYWKGHLAGRDVRLEQGVGAADRRLVLT